MERYLDELWETLQAVSIRAEGAELGLAGMARLLSLFLRKRGGGSLVSFIGNGGSAAIAGHMTADFFKNGRMRTIGLFDAPALTCFGNDYGYEHVFSKQIERVMGEGDLLVAISSSGRSPNIVNAIDAAHGNGATVLSLTGFSPDNPSRERADASLWVPSDRYGIVESIHGVLLQAIVDAMKEQDEA